MGWFFSLENTKNKFSDIFTLNLNSFSRLSGRTAAFALFSLSSQPSHRTLTVFCSKQNPDVYILKKAKPHVSLDKWSAPLNPRPSCCEASLRCFCVELAHVTQIMAQIYNVINLLFMHMSISVQCPAMTSAGII